MLFGTVILGGSLFILLVVLVGGILLQIFLSKKENKVLGLILPIITFLCSLLPLLNLMAFDSMTAWDIFITLAVTVIVANIPTIVLLGIYFACKEKIKRKKQLEKMNIQDLG